MIISTLSENQPKDSLTMNIAVNVNGRLTDAATATVSPLDRGFLFGEGVYETLRTYNRQPFLLDRHLARLRASANLISLKVPLDDSACRERLAQTMTGVSDTDSELYLRILLTRGVGDLTYDPDSCPTPTVMMMARPYVETSAETINNGIKIVLSSIMRNHPDALNPRIKSNNLLNNALAMQEAIRAGADEALMCNYRGEIAECSQSNIFIVRDGVAQTPALDTGLLEGVTRNFLFEVGAAANIPVREAILLPNDLAKADEVFITGTTREVLAVTSIDETPVRDGRPGPITELLAKTFSELALAMTST